MAWIQQSPGVVTANGDLASGPGFDMRVRRIAFRGLTAGAVQIKGVTVIDYATWVAAGLVPEEGMYLGGLPVRSADITTSGTAGLGHKIQFFYE